MDDHTPDELRAIWQELDSLRREITMLKLQVSENTNHHILIGSASTGGGFLVGSPTIPGTEQDEG